MDRPTYSTIYIEVIKMTDDDGWRRAKAGIVLWKQEKKKKKKKNNNITYICIK